MRNVSIGVACLIALVVPAAVGGKPATSSPRGTIGVASSVDFETVLLMTPVGGAVDQVRAPDRIFSLRADISRDGKRIAIAGLRGIWVFPRSGAGARRRVVKAPPTAFAPDWVTWSPHGERLVFTRGQALFTVATTGGKVKKILGGPAYAPDWSPTGTHIVFVRDPAESTGAGLIQSVRPDGRDLRSIVRGGHPDISPDGSRLAFSRPEGIYVMSMTGGKPKLVIRNGERPEWSPDGRYLAFTRQVVCGDAVCSGRVFIVRATGGKARAIGPEIFDIGPLSWSK